MMNLHALVKSLKEIFIFALLVTAFIGLYFVYNKVKSINSSPLIIQKCTSVNEEMISIIVDIEGEVENPGVYKLTTGSLVNDAIEIAEGLTSEADLDYVALNINKASQLVDGQKIYIPSISESNISNNIDIPIKNSSKININAASESELDNLPGIGKTYVQRIIQGRPYNTIEDIKKVEGIGESLFEKIKDLITV